MKVPCRKTEGADLHSNLEVDKVPKSFFGQSDLVSCSPEAFVDEFLNMYPKVDPQASLTQYKSSHGDFGISLHHC